MQRFTRSTLLCTLCMICGVLAARARAADADPAAEAKAKQAQAIAALKSDAPGQAKADACKQLAIYGSTAEAVPLLIPLLGDDKLATWARIALETNSTPEADAALRDAAAKLPGRLAIGSIQSIVRRHDEKAGELLIARLKDADGEVASAAAVALGDLGTPAGEKTLEAALPTASAATASAIAEGCMRYAEKAMARGDAARAIQLYDLVRKTELPKQRIVEATRGAILARGDAGIPLLVEQLKATDKQLFGIGLHTAREMPSAEVTKALLVELAGATDERQALLLLALADRRDPAALPAIAQAAKAGPTAVRLVALRVLKRLGDASNVPALLDATQESDADVAQAAIDTLAEIRGQAIDDDLAARLGKAEGKPRLVLIQLAGQRHLVSAVPTLMKASQDADDATRIAALTALGLTLEFNDLPQLIAKVTNPPAKPEEAQAAADALASVCQRMADRDACAAKLGAAMEQAPMATKLKFLEILSAVGGAKALEIVAAAAKSSDAELQDAASQILGKWMTADAAPVLLDLSKTVPGLEVRALRGYLRIAKQFDMSEHERVTMCREALAASKRPQEKKLILDVLKVKPGMESLQMAIELTKVSGLATDAKAAALAIGGKVRGHEQQVKKMLAMLGQEKVDLEILKAEYGAGAQARDVTTILSRQVNGFALIALPSSNFNKTFGGDPAPGKVKQLKVQYRMNGKTGEAAFGENETIILPMPK